MNAMLGILVLGVLGVGAVDVPPVSEPGEGAYLSGKLIYPLDDKPTPQCHASTLAETPSGIVAAWFGGTEERNPDVGIWVSRLDGTGWSEPVEVADGVQSEDLRYPCWNPVLYRLEDRLLLFYKVGPSPSTWWGMLMESEDDGRTWSAGRKLGEGPLGALLGPVKNKPEMIKGELWCPSSTEHEGWRVHFEVTADGGKTWRVVGPINDGKEYGAIQPSILTYPDGRMQVLCRSQQNVLTQAWSEDGGTTWGPMTATMLPNPSSGTDAVTLADGRQLLVYNHTTRSRDASVFPSGRDMINVAISSDGLDWKPVLTLEKERAHGGFCYPAVIQAQDSKVHILYTYMRYSIKHVVLDPAKLD